SALGARAPSTPGPGTISCRYTVDATTAIPSDSSSAATARSTRSSRTWPTRAIRATARGSGRNSRKSRGLAMPPTITVRRTPAARGPAARGRLAARLPAVKEEPVGALERGDRVRCEAPAAEPDRVQAVEPRPIAGDRAEGRDVHRHHRAGGAQRRFADPDVLM